jgi:hypothetical protein
MPVSDMVEEALNQMLIGGSQFPDIESFIERQPFSEEQKAALWLWAWAEQARPARQHLSSPAGRIPAGV